MGIVDIGQREGDAHGGNLGRLLPAAAERRNGSSGRAGDEDLEEVERDRFSTGLAFNGDDAAIELAAAGLGEAFGVKGRKELDVSEFAGEAIRSLSMEGRMTVCNMSIECGARGGMIAPDRTTFDYLRGRERAPQGAAFDQAVARWETLYSDADAVFDKEYRFDAADIAPMITYGTNPGMGMAVDAQIPAEADPKALEYMGFKAGEKLLGKPVDYVFVGSCTNGRIEDLRRFAKLVEGRRKAQGVTAWIVPGSKGVEAAARAEGLDKVLAAAGFELRQPGCSACLAMNADKIPAGKYSVSTSNRNFEGRQGPGARTMLAGIAVAAAAAVCGRIEDPRKVFEM